MKKQQLEVCVTLIGLFQLLVSGLVLVFSAASLAIFINFLFLQVYPKQNYKSLRR
jgi:hypothetical protein